MITRPGPIFFISFIVGLVQIGLSYAAGVHLHSSVQAIHRFGYLECYNWSVTYLTVAPTILAACIPNTIVLFRQSIGQPAYRKRFLVLLALAFVFAAGTAGREAWQALYDMERDGGYIEWSSMSAGDWNAHDQSRLQRVLWYALFFLGYAHYFVASFFGFTGAFGTFWYFNLVSRAKQPRKLLQYEEGLLFNQKIAVLAYLLFLVFLRSAKVSMSLIANGKAEETWRFFDFFKHGEAYLDVISGGLLLDLLFGAFWLSVTLVTHGLAYQLLSPRTVTPAQTQFLQHIFDRAADAYAYFGKGARFWAGVFLFGIVVPAPGFPLLVGEAIFFSGLQLIRSGLSRSKD